MTLEECVSRAWLHSQEEDSGDEMVYRPVGYRFPPARGRRGFELHGGGEAVYYGIAAADGRDRIPASWTFSEPDQLEIQYEDGRPPLVLHVVSCSEDKLVVRA